MDSAKAASDAFLNSALGEVGNGVISCAADLVLDLIVLLDEPVYENGVVGARFQPVRGGSAGNVAEAIAYAGGKARFSGQVGEDNIGTQMVNELFHRGVEVRAAHRGRSAQLLSLVNPDGHRSFVVDTGDQTCLYPDDIESTWLEDVSILHISGYAFARDQIGDTMLYMARKAQDLGIKVTLDVGSPNLIVNCRLERYLEKLSIAKPHVLFLNENEADQLHVPTDKETLAVARLNEVVPDGVNILILHRGPQSTFVITRECWIEVECERVERIVDTTGAGDAFSAGFLYGWQQGLNITKCVDAGHDLAQKVIQKPGGSLFE